MQCGIDTAGNLKTFQDMVPFGSTFTDYGFSGVKGKQVL